VSVCVASDDSESDTDTDDDRTRVPLPNVRKKKRTGPRNRIATHKRLKVDHEEIQLVDGTEENEVPFCCAICKCPESVKQKLEIGDDLGNRIQWINPSQDGLFLSHRMCCHGLIKREEESLEAFEKRKSEWAPPCFVAQAWEGDRKPDAFSKTLEWIDKRRLRDAYNIDKKQESQMFNDDQDEKAKDKLMTHQEYHPKFLQPFHNRVKEMEDEPEKRRNAVVLDCFAGVGTGVLVLKRLQIAMKKIIYIDHDKVARHVYRSNHDRKYHNADAEEDDKIPKERKKIDHVYEYETWESLVGSAKGGCSFDSKKMKVFVEKHGPIDIMLGGPPCIEYSKVNAYRKGTDSKQGQYLTQFGEVANFIQSVQETPLYYLAENVVVRDDDLFELRKKFKLDHDPINLDAQYFSPARRNRHFWTNIPLEDFDYSDKGIDSDPRSCLEEGFCVKGQIIEDDMSVKCNCLMASMARIDEPTSFRMYVFEKKPKDKKYFGRPLLVVERERLMGYPEGYIEKPVRMLFKKLLDDALVLNNKNDEKWRQRLHEKYYHFSGNYHNVPWAALEGNFHQFDAIWEGPLAKLKLTAAYDRGNDASNASTIQFYDAEEYAKHLVGLAYSVPVVEHLLKPLRKIFKTRYYGKFSDYHYKWQDKTAPPATAPDANREIPQQNNPVSVKEESTDDEQIPKPSFTIPGKMMAVKQEVGL